MFFSHLAWSPHLCHLGLSNACPLSVSLLVFFSSKLFFLFFFRRLGSKDEAFRPAPLLQRTHAKTRGVGVDYLCLPRRFFSFCFSLILLSLHTCVI